MERVKSELKLGELKRENLRKSMEQIKAQASSLLLFTLQGEELERHFDLLQRHIAERVEAVELQEKALENATEELNAELKLKQDQIGSIQKSYEECSSDLKLKQQYLGSLKKLIEGCSKELSLKEEQLCSMQKLISECCENLEAKEKQLGLVEEHVQKSNEDIDKKKENLDLLQSSVEECEGKLESKKKDLDLVTRRVDKCCDEIRLKDDQLDHLQRSIDEKSRDLELKMVDIVSKENMIKEYDKELYEKEKALDSYKSLIQDCTEALEAKEEKYDALDKSVRCYADKLKFKVEELGLIEEKIAAHSSKLHSRDFELDSLQKSVRLSDKQLESTKEALDSVKARMREYSKDLELKMQESNAIQKCIEERSQELHSKEKQLSSVQISIQGCSQKLKADEEELISIKNLISECSNELESKQQHLEAVQKSLEQLSDNLESKEKQLDLVEKACSEGLKKADAKERQLVSLERSVEECSEKLETEKRQFDARVKEFELREKQFVSVQKAVEERSKELVLKEKQLENTLHSQVRRDGSSSLFSQVDGTTNTGTVNPTAPNQIKIEWPEHFMFGNANETSFTDVGVGASMDGRSLQGIPDEPDLRQNEVLDALQNSPNPAKFVLDLMLGTSSEYQNKVGKGVDESVLKTYVLVLEQLLQVSPFVETEVKENALKLAIEWKAKMKLISENSSEIMGFLQFVAAFGLVSHFNKDEIFKLLETAAQHQKARNVCRILGFTDMIPDFVHSLIERKQYIQAIRFVSAFDSKDKCPPEMLLNLCWDHINRVALDGCRMGKNLPEVQEKAKDEHFAALKSVIQCIKDCNLESSLPVGVIKSIAELEKQKMNKIFVAPAPAPALQLKVQGQTNCYTGPSVPRNHPSPVPPVHPSTSVTQLRRVSNKRARTDIPVINSYTPQRPTVNNPNNQSASQQGLGVPLNQGVFHSYKKGVVYFGQPTNLGDHTSQGPGKKTSLKNDA